jgi:hypothetical protein
MPPKTSADSIKKQTSKSSVKKSISSGVKKRTYDMSHITGKKLSEKPVKK